MIAEADERAWYAAFKAKDPRFDGRLFVGVSSTGIYCRPVCGAKMPKPENCTFYETAAEAEQAGYRPCLVCRPELAPGLSITDARASLARRAAKLLEENFTSGSNLEELAGRLGCTDRHLRRVFTEQYHVSPIQYLQTCRLLLAKNLLTDTDLSIAHIALSAGFGSVRRFNDSFRKHYRLSPRDLRKQVNRNKLENDTITLSLSYRPPYRFNEVLDFLALRAIPGVELVRERSYSRTVRLSADGAVGWIQVEPHPRKEVLTLTLSSSLLPVLPSLLSRVNLLFDLQSDPDVIAETLISMNELRPGLFKPGVRMPGCFDAFEMAVRAVLGQQITVKAASTLAGRLVRAYGTPVDTKVEGLTHLFPTPEHICELKGDISDHLGPLGITSARARTILSLAHVFAEQSIDFGLTANPEVEMEKLLALPGIGKWTAHYIAMRAMSWPDAFLDTDLGVKKALDDRAPKEIRILAEQWRPWRSYATMSLWNSL